MTVSTPIMRLDEVLTVFHTSPKYKQGLSREDVKAEISFTDDEELIRILDKLRNDHYIANRSFSGSNNQFITHDGVVHHLSGGYQGQIDRANRLQDQADIQRTNQTSLQRTLNKLTAWIAVASVIAAAYYFLEICKWVYSLFCGINS